MTARDITSLVGGGPGAGACVLVVLATLEGWMVGTLARWRFTR
jgi:hypothetical protein